MLCMLLLLLLLVAAAGVAYVLNTQPDKMAWAQQVVAVLQQHPHMQSIQQHAYVQTAQQQATQLHQQVSSLIQPWLTRLKDEL